MALIRRHRTFEKYKNEYDYVSLRREAGILEIRIHDKEDPTQSAIWGIPPHGELSYLFYDVSRDYENEVVILTGTGEHFIGPEPDLKGPFPPTIWDEVYHNCKHLQMNLLNIEVPVISAINGPIGVHSELALFSDIVIASDDATFTDWAHFGNGNVPGDTVQLCYMGILGPNRGRYFLMTGQKLSAQEAKELGMVNEVLPKDKVLDRAWYWARHIAARPRLARRYARTLLTQEWRRQLVSETSHGIALEGLNAALSWGLGTEHTKKPIPPGFDYNQHLIDEHNK